MKKNENYPKYVQAMRLMDVGKLPHTVARTVGVRRYPKATGGRRQLKAPGCAGLAKPEGDVPGSVSFPDTLPSGVGATR